MKLDGIGEFRARVSMGGGVIPLEGAAVIIRGSENRNSDITHLLFSDTDGLTEMIALPTPNIDYSLIPNPSEAPFSKYSVEVIMPGFERQYIEALIFDERTSFQEFNLLPLQAFE